MPGTGGKRRLERGPFDRIAITTVSYDLHDELHKILFKSSVSVLSCSEKQISLAVKTKNFINSIKHKWQEKFPFVYFNDNFIHLQRLVSKRQQELHNTNYY